MLRPCAFTEEAVSSLQTRIDFVQDPNRPVSQQLIREARIGLTIVALLAGLFCYVAWNRFSGNWDQVPDHVANAPIAQNMNEKFREEHRREIAKLDTTPRIARNQTPDTSNSVTNDNPRAPIQQTFTQQRVNSDSVADSNKTPKPLLPISTNELRSDDPVDLEDSNVRPASFNDESGDRKFDDPFGPSGSSSGLQPNTRDSETDFAPRKPFRLSDEEASEFKNNVAPQTGPGADSTPEKNTQPPTIPDNSSFQPNPRQPSVVMQRTKFQVQVVEDPDDDGSMNYQPQQTTNAVNNNSFNNNFKPVQRSNQAATPNVKEHKPLTRAEDFATHSLHPPRPVQPTTASLPVETPTIQKTVTKLKEQYTVQNQPQTLWEVAQEVYGDGRLFRAVYEINRNQIANPEILPVGTQLVVPELEELIQKYRAHVPDDLVPMSEDEGVYITQSDDTLFDIARQRLGQASRFNELIELNRTRLPHNVSHLSPLAAGMRIQLPKN